jgi:hypothetical protein
MATKSKDYTAPIVITLFLGLWISSAIIFRESLQAQTGTTLAAAIVTPHGRKRDYTDRKRPTS